MLSAVLLRGVDAGQFIWRKFGATRRHQRLDLERGTKTFRRRQQRRYFLLRVQILAFAELSREIFCGAEEIIAANHFER